MQQYTSDWDARFRLGDTPWEDPEVPQCAVDLVREFAPVGTTVLEVGCGSGQMAIWLAEQGYRVLACDISAEAVRQSRQLAERRASEAKFVVADILSPDGMLPKVQIVVSRGLLHTFVHHEGRLALAAAVSGHLAPDGLWLDISGSADNVDPPGDRARLGLPRLTLGELTSAVEGHFEFLVVRRATYGTVPGQTDFLAWVSALRRRADPSSTG